VIASTTFMAWTRAWADALFAISALAIGIPPLNEPCTSSGRRDTGQQCDTFGTYAFLEMFPRHDPQLAGPARRLYIGPLRKSHEASSMNGGASRDWADGLAAGICFLR